MSDLYQIGAHGIALSLDLANGHIASLAIEAEGRALQPLHRAPWIDSGETMPEGTSPGLARLSGDFFCAPFSRNDIEPAPGHGWSANAPWELLSDDAIPGGRHARFRLSRTIFGATVEKELVLRDGHPFVYQEHRLIGGGGGISVSHHLMTHMEEGALLGFSPKRFAVTPGTSLEPDPSRGRYALAYPAQTADLSAFPLADGGTVDLHAYPPSERHEDFLTLAEQEGRALGWTTVSRHAERDMLLVLKRPDVLPVTMLWMSNGGRDYAPWNGRHTGVLGIEDARASSDGHTASLGDNELTRQGVPTAFELGGEIVVRQAFGAIPLAQTHVPVADVRMEAERVVIAFADGTKRELPFDGSFLA